MLVFLKEVMEVLVVKGMNLEEGGHIVGVATSLEGENILSVSEKGLAKMTNYKEYRLTKRGSKGVITMRITERTGALIAVRPIDLTSSSLNIQTLPSDDPKMI